MLVEFYLRRESPETFITSSSNMESVPHGLVQIGDKVYRTMDVPCFVLDARNDANKNSYFRRVVVLLDEDDYR